jgi:hypothetical protein
MRRRRSQKALKKDTEISNRVKQNRCEGQNDSLEGCGVVVTHHAPPH